MKKKLAFAILFTLLFINCINYTKKESQMDKKYLTQIEKYNAYYTDGVSIFFVKSNKYNSSGFLTDFDNGIDSLQITDNDAKLSEPFGQITTVEIAKEKETGIQIHNFVTLAYKLENVSLNGFKILKNGYSTFNNRLYCEYTEIPEADIESFVIIDSNKYRMDYAKDKNNVYRNRAKVKDADPSTFTIINEQFSKDKNYVFFGDEIIENAIPNTFQIINEAYQRDQKQIWHRGKLIKADANTFEILTDYYARDKDHVYIEGQVLKDADPKSFRLEETGPPHISYGIDKYHVYYGYDLMEEVDIKTFKVVKSEYRKWDAFDKNNRYERDKVVKKR